MLVRSIKLHSPKLAYRPEIDGLRALAVIPVILFHADFEWFRGGYVGVDVFFVISGYLITSIILAEKQAGTFSLAGFYERRARRILPALFLVMIVCLPFARVWMVPEELKDFFKSLIAVSLFISNVYFLRTSGYFDGTADEKPFLHAWSLSVEEQYYLLFPLLILLFWRLGRKRLTWFIGLALVASLTLSEWASRAHPMVNFYLLPTRAWEICMGSLLALTIFNRPVQEKVDRRVASLLGVLGLLLILYAVFCYDRTIRYPSFYTLVPTIGTILVLAFASKENFAGKLLSLKAMVGIGLISYSSYLWHKPLFAFARINNIYSPAPLTFGFLTAVSFGLALMSWRYVEIPFRNKGIMSRKTIFLSGAMVSLAIIGIGTGGIFLEKLSERKAQGENIARIDFNALANERKQLIRIGICHYNENVVGASINDFLKNWRCVGNEESMKVLPILIAGDSTSADKALALRLNGFDVAAMGGAGCSLMPSKMTPSCRKQFDFVKSWLSKQDKIKAVVLSRKYKKDELNIVAFEEMIKFWAVPGKKLIIFTQMPEFKHLKALVDRALRNGVPAKEIKLAPFIEDALKSEQITYEIEKNNHNVYVINTRSLFRSLTDAYSWEKDGKSLLIDDTHLSKFGAECMGCQIIPELIEIVQQP